MKREMITYHISFTATDLSLMIQDFTDIQENLFQGYLPFDFLILELFLYEKKTSFELLIERIDLYQKIDSQYPS